MSTCGCGCGALTTIATQADARYGHVKGQPRRFLVGHSRRLPDPTAPSVDERFWSKVHRRGPDECWPWLAGRDARGYGRFAVTKRKIISAPRFALGLIEPSVLPDRQIACHHCDNPPCVNPAHLFVGTDADNVHDMIAKGRARSGIRESEKTCCPRGHAYDQANTRITKRGRRTCRSCERARRVAS